MEYAEFWILELALDAGAPLSLIVGPPDEIEAQWNKPYHGLSRQEMLNLLDKLATNGDIVAMGENSVEFTPDRQQIDSWLVYAHPCKTQRWYRLTPRGGKRWETFSNARWDRYHSFEWSFESDSEKDDILEIAATTRDAAERAFNYSIPWNRLRVFPESIECRTLQPWSATYWKTLQVGHSIRSKCQYLDDLDLIDALCFPGQSDSEVRDSWSQVRREYDYFHSWYAPHPQTPKKGVT